MSAREVAQAAQQAAKRLSGRARITPLDPCPWLRSMTGAFVYLKLESEQLTGSFKLRGALNKLLDLEAPELAKGLVTSSSGNHGIAVVHAYSLCEPCSGSAPLVLLPETVSRFKLERLKARGASTVLHGQDAVAAENEARRVSEEKGMVYVSPYNDLQVVAGQGTVAVEILDQVPGGKVDVAFVPVGGGGLISGVASVLKAANPCVHIVGCQPSASHVMHQSVMAGKILDVPSDHTLSDGTAGGVEAGALTFPLCQQLVDEWVLVDEEEISTALLGLLHHHGKLVEGAAAVAVAAVLQKREELEGKVVVIICCGGNISLDTLRKVMNTATVVDDL